MEKKHYYKRDTDNQIIPPDYTLNGIPYYYNHGIAEYEATVDGRYYCTVHVPSKRTEKNNAKGEKKYWARLDREAKARAKIVCPHIPKRAKLTYKGIIN